MASMLRQIAVPVGSFTEPDLPPSMMGCGPTLWHVPKYVSGIRGCHHSVTTLLFLYTVVNKIPSIIFTPSSRIQLKPRTPHLVRAARSPVNFGDLHLHPIAVSELSSRKQGIRTSCVLHCSLAVRSSGVQFTESSLPVPELEPSECGKNAAARPDCPAPADPPDGPPAERAGNPGPTNTLSCLNQDSQYLGIPLLNPICHSHGHWQGLYMVSDIPSCRPRPGLDLGIHDVSFRPIASETIPQGSSPSLPKYLIILPSASKGVI
ncbi:uncharacterized protein CLUP02_08430 [Colletotrichum lupini]|uniref:Uncharacterized protein n=1 Tax=Colletotrichum lupini TaxID=145971 RepID=A0A9Q8WHL8_9PEZI|nr:uncharacterized protein CLUP02_08430 [Colletotrichum lupini]UQC82940.1 hypothetical protein CLUP02_08430 [Colletotrichum lupini]